MTSQPPLPPSAFAETASAIAAAEAALDALQARMWAEATVMRLRIVNAVNGVAARLRAESLEGLEQ